MADRVLHASGVSYRYPGSSTAALEGVDLEVGAGEFVVLAGRSGSGKSTLLRAASGLVPHFHGGEFSGALVVDGRSTREAGPAELAVSVGFVAQEPESQVISTTIAAELELPLELRGVGATERGRAVEEVALALGIEAILERTTDSLSGGELQRVALAAALVTRPPLVLLDEPTSQLDPARGEELIALLRRLNEDSGVAVIVCEHRLERCLAAADRVIALDRGRVIFDGPAAGAGAGGFGSFATERAPWLATSASRLFQLAGRPERPATVKEARRLLAGEPIAEPLPPEPSPPTGGRAAAVRDLHVDLGERAERRRVLRGADLEIGAGERVALMGASGAGKSTLLRALAGLVDPASGSAGAPGGCALLTQRPDDYLVRELVGEELPGVAGRRALDVVGLDVEGSRDSRDLSGGERQRLALAIALAGRGAGGRPPGLVALDEPTRGLDPEHREDLVAWLHGLADSGAALLVATHDSEFAALLADRVVLIGRGRIVADGPAAEVLAGGWYFTSETARITDGAAITPEAGAALLPGPGGATAPTTARGAVG